MGARLPYFYDFGPFRLDPRQHLLLRNGAPLSLSPKSFETLLVLARSRGRVVEKDELLRSVWPNCFVEEATLAQNVFTLRKLLGGGAGAVDEYIKTVPKRGYRFVAAVTESRQSDSEQVVDSTEPTDSIMSLAVMPIVDAVPDAVSEHLINGLTEKIVNHLYVLPKLHVKACSTLNLYSRAEIDPQRAGVDLGVTAILIGRVIHSDDEVTIAMELVDVRNGWQLWGQHYSEKLADAFSAQRAIADDIANNLRINLTGIDPESQTA